MPHDLSSNPEIIATMEAYLETTRPPIEIRPQLDIGYELVGQSVILNEIRPVWRAPHDIQHQPYAKATYVKSRNLWKVYWMRASLKWDAYDPKPTVKTLRAFLKLVDEDKYGCFKG
jgi:hypothetical protein